MDNKRFAAVLTWSLLGVATIVALAIPDSLPGVHADDDDDDDDRGAQYQYAYQRPVGDRAIFYVSGEATGEDPDPQADAILTRVEFPGGTNFIHFYMPVAIHNLDIQDEFKKWQVTAGKKCTIGLSDVVHVMGSADGNPDNVTDTDREAFSALMLQAFQNNNLNNYVDCYHDDARFTFTVEFDRVVKDNDPDSDDFGEILYFERGSGDGNSWLKMQAVDSSGNALGPWLVIGPTETVQTTPPTTVLRDGQRMGTTAIDVSRLGVTEFKYLRVSNDCSGDSAYTGGGDRQPDFKIMAVMTNTEQLAEIMFD